MTVLPVLALASVLFIFFFSFEHGLKALPFLKYEFFFSNLAPAIILPFQHDGWPETLQLLHIPPVLYTHLSLSLRHYDGISSSHQTRNRNEFSKALEHHIVVHIN